MEGIQPRRVEKISLKMNSLLEQQASPVKSTGACAANSIHCSHVTPFPLPRLPPVSFPSFPLVFISLYQSPYITTIYPCRSPGACIRAHAIVWCKKQTHSRPFQINTATFSLSSAMVINALSLVWSSCEGILIGVQPVLLIFLVFIFRCGAIV